jgi:hypothetical protein
MVIKKYLLNDGRRLVIWYEDDSESPREWDNTWKLCIRKHRNYNFPNELNFDFETDEDDDLLSERLKAIWFSYHIFRLDCYEHSWISFSLAWQGMQCRFDTSNNCGFIAIPKKDDSNPSIENTYDDAKKIAESEIKIYNQYLNWEIYRYITEKPVKWTSEDGQEKIEREFEDWCGGYYDIQYILDEYKSLSPKEI